MAEGGEDDPQRMKKIAAAAYEYDRDPRWAEYWSNILIPPHMAARSDVVDHYKRKFYQRHIDPDLMVDPIASSSSQSRVRSRTGGIGASEQSHPENAVPNSNSTRTDPSATNSMRLGQQTVQFSANLWVLLMILLSILPPMPRSLTNKAYRLSLLGMVFSLVFSLHRRHGKPAAWNLPVLKTWLQSMIVERDFLYLIYCLIFVPFPPNFKFALLPLLFRAVEHVAKFMRRNFSHSLLYRKYFEGTCLWVEANATKLNILSSIFEVALGFLLILALFTWQRNIIQVFIYWHLLKLMYLVPATAGHHRDVWAKIGWTVTPYINRYAPFLNSPLSAVQRWWLS